MKFTVFTALSTALVLSACAPRPDTIQGTYTSSVLYQNLNCDQLASEAQNVSNRAHTAAGLQQRHRTEDTVAVTAGLVIFWPALFFTHGADATAAELAQLRGEIAAIERASQAKNCGIVFQRA